MNIVLHSITLAVLYTAIKYYNPGDEIEEPMVPQNTVPTDIASDANLNFVVFQQAKMSAEIQNLKNELEHIQMKSREAHSMELRSCMKLVGDLREQTDQKLLSTDDKVLSNHLECKWKIFIYQNITN